MRTLFRITAVTLTAVGLAAPAAAQGAVLLDVETLRGWLAGAQWAAAAQAGALRAREAAERQRDAIERARRQREAARQALERERRTWPEVTEAFSRTVRLGRNGTFDLQNVNGEVVVTGGGGDEVRIKATKRVRHPMAATARAALQQLQIDVTERGGNVEVRTDYPRRIRNVVTAVDYTVTVPEDANVVLASVSGNVRVSNVNGELRANAVSGNITAASVGRVRQLTTVSGDVEISNGETDELTATTVDGDVVLRNVKGRIVELTTVTGNARLIDVELARANLQSMAGDLEFAGRLARSGRYEFQTHSGNIRVSPAGDPGFDLDATTFSGDVRSDFALKATAAPNRRGVQRSLRGTFGDAAAVVSAQSFAGDILIVR